MASDFSFHIQEFFPTKVAVSQISDCDDLNQRLLQDVYKIRDQNPNTVSEWDCTIYTSVRLPAKVHNTEAFNELRKYLDTAVLKFATHTGYPDGWQPVQEDSLFFNIASKYDYQEVHEHLPYFYSGVYYVTAPIGSGNLFIMDPSVIIGGKGWQKATKEYEPKPGRLLVFDSGARHGVRQNLADGDRVSISFNYHLGPPESL